MSENELKIGGAPTNAAETAGAGDTKKPAAKKAGTSKATTGPNEVTRTRIILAKNDEVPPSGLFIGHNGVGYKLLPGKEADVPDFLLDILDNAVVKKPVVGDNGRITGFEDSPRYPYTVVRKKS